METAAPVRVHIRWMIRQDLPEVQYIEDHSFEYSWLEQDFLGMLNRRNCIGQVAELGEKVVGFMVCTYHEKKIAVVNFAVHPDFRHRGVGTQLVNKLKSKLSNPTNQRNGRTRITLEVREANLPAQLFFRKQGFRALRVLRAFYEDSGEDAYHLEYQSAGDTLEGEELEE